MYFNHVGHKKHGLSLKKIIFSNTKKKKKEIFLKGL